MNFSLYRIIGNSLPPRHSHENNLRSVDFIIRNEPRFEGCERVWILNKISAPNEKERLIALLDGERENYIDLPFDPQAHLDAFFDPTGLPADQMARLAIDIFQKVPLLQEWIARHKSQRLVGINQARNLALQLGRQRSTWTLVLDGGVVFTGLRWTRFLAALRPDAGKRLAVIPMRRVYDWDDALQLCASERNSDLHATDEDPSEEEPQIAFHRDSTEIFDERLRYGHRNKAELLSRIGLPGPWMQWQPSAWESASPLPAPNKENYVVAGSVIRLPTDGAGREQGADRYANRFFGVARRALEVDLQVAAGLRRPAQDSFARGHAALTPESRDEFLRFARELLAEKDRFVTDKTVAAPSGNRHDYHSAAPYWTREGIQVDGILHVSQADDDPSSGRYDRNALRRFATRVYGLTLAGDAFSDRDMLDKAAELLRKWMLEESTRMTPTARFAQCVPGRAEPNDVGLVEFRHLALLPSAIRILAGRRILPSGAVGDIRAWFAAFLRDCETIGVLAKSLNRVNNIGTWAGVLFCSSALFTEDFGNAFYLAETASIRLGKQLGLFSSQPHECERTRPLHYSLFNLSAWTMMVRHAEQCAIRLLTFKGTRGESIADALSFCSDNRHRFSDYAENRIEQDLWIELLGKLLSGRETGEIAVVRNADLGLPPVLLL